MERVESVTSEFPKQRLTSHKASTDSLSTAPNDRIIELIRRNSTRHLGKPVKDRPFMLPLGSTRVPES
jgi:hypothetical protein